MDLPGETRRYEVAGKKHHHHFHCTLCGKLFELAGCGLVMRHRLPAGFTAERHEFFSVWKLRGVRGAREVSARVPGCCCDCVIIIICR